MSDVNVAALLQRSHGLGLIQRALYISHVVPERKHVALTTALAEVKKGCNTDLYQLISDQLSTGPDSVPFDVAWVQATAAANSTRPERLSQAVSKANRSVVRDQIRQALLEQADFLLSKGDFTTAVQRYLDAEDHSSTARDAVETAVRSCRACVYYRSYDQIKFHVASAQRHPTELESSPSTAAMLHACLAIYHLQHNNPAFKSAARACRAVNGAVWNEAQCSDIVSLTEIATYAVLLTLATSTRAELRSQLFESTEIKSLTALVPQLTNATADFLLSKYASCLQILEQLKATLLLDLYIGPHVNKLFDMIRSEAMVSYFSPYSSVDLNQMSVAFGLDIPSLERELSALITAKKLNARIDSERQALCAHESDTRVEALQRAASVSDSYIAHAQAMLWHTTLANSNLMIETARQS